MLPAGRMCGGGRIETSFWCSLIVLRCMRCLDYRMLVWVSLVFLILFSSSELSVAFSCKPSSLFFLLLDVAVPLFFLLFVYVGF